MIKKLLMDILELTKMQGEALASENLNRFSVIVQRKQVLIEKIDELRRNQPDFNIEEVREIIEAIQVQDQMNRVEFDRQYEESKAKVRQGRMMEQKSTAYTNPYTRYQERGIFFDRKRV